MIDTLIDQLVKLRRTYGHIEVDLDSDGCFQATHSDVGIRIDEFGDVIAVIQSAYNKKTKGFNQLMQNDSWLQFTSECRRQRGQAALGGGWQA